jgi:hypothetical protein
MQHTWQQLSKMSKDQLAQMHAANGGLMGVQTYRKWTKDELVKAVLEDQQWIEDDARLATQSDSYDPTTGIFDLDTGEKVG